MSGGIKWYLRPVMIFLEILTLGPFALPFVWISPALKRWHKIAVTVLVAAVTIWMAKVTADMYGILLQELRQIDAILNPRLTGT